jgi:hypothetical protein
MFKQVFDNDFVIIKHDRDKGVAVLKWKGKCGNIIDQKHTTLFDDIRNLIKNISPEKLLADMSDCDYHLTPDTGTWFENPMFAMYGNLPPKQIAIIVPQNLFVNAFFDASRAYEITGPNVKLQYFEEAEKAWNWLSS